MPARILEKECEPPASSSGDCLVLGVEEAVADPREPLRVVVLLGVSVLRPELVGLGVAPLLFVRLHVVQRPVNVLVVVALLLVGIEEELGEPDRR
eukprot:CAMPEP_0206219886 /NCGR_PEP_ID=MMETSP0047_2-20121206/4559_1 /ASSEMBLY_ACC=CAM_ASM_000192 /TAXON_ID=195065 /ORGANISM="Chroomonas mesostigmatica_cf, Strain CCMP1168" /LENGTH=94 /DNA_ID=CAMNT_0053642461 /DNA_START=278 /DNA_END=562 /DNA_ORIENTATION=-